MTKALQVVSDVKIDAKLESCARATCDTLLRPKSLPFDRVGREEEGGALGVVDSACVSRTRVGLHSKGSSLGKGEERSKQQQPFPNSEP